MKFLRIAVLALASVAVGFGFAQEEEVPLDGEALYNQSCAGCHMPDGTGQEERIPALAAHVPHLANAEGGREYLMNVVMWGLSGEITVLGETFDRSMPARFTLANEELAAILNYIVTAWGNDALLNDDVAEFTADELNEVRRTSREWALQFRPDIDPEL